ncbi:MAG: alkaline phosphatase family protein [Leptolyngbyaceae cyanobacterium SM1_1_3]|nr:alkaline phosphatase family protein [Leptolyngbyaceae cyanobacterium SM1_1_3]NJN04216.1 alkaline phosphatase family protein [Leptolyngbyaceae cyanobacterium RM1_1_2]NJO08346.1 alkaline phosphatase family protein [Leptolyngbyaceae cyanobacterium SL_1_1]
MLNLDSLQAVEAARLDDNIGKPLYQSYCFSQIPQLVRYLLTEDTNAGLPKTVLEGLPHQYDQVILILVDGFGWRFFERYRDRLPFLRRLLESGVASKLTTQFPSTTSAHVTTLHTGLPVGESGVYEWFYYEPLIDDIFAPLLFSLAGDKERETLTHRGIKPESLFPTQTLYQDLAKQGVKSYCFQHQNYAHSPFSKTVCNGAEMVSFRTLPEAMTNLAEAAIAQSGKAYYCFYIDAIDAIAHRYSPNSAQFEAEVSALWLLMEQLLHQSLAGHLHNTLLLITADHGQIEVLPENTLYLNQLTPSIEPWIRRNAQGRPLVPAGGSRDMFLYIQDNFLDKAHSLLTQQLANKATVYYTKTLLEAGYFGLDPSLRLQERLGNLVILPHQHELVWWYEKDRFEEHHKGHHGGLCRDEMETLLLAIAYP